MNGFVIGVTAGAFYNPSMTDPPNSQTVPASSIYLGYGWQHQTILLIGTPPIYSVSAGSYEFPNSTISVIGKKQLFGGGAQYMLSLYGKRGVTAMDFGCTLGLWSCENDFNAMGKSEKFNRYYYVAPVLRGKAGYKHVYVFMELSEFMGESFSLAPAIGLWVSL